LQVRFFDRSIFAAAALAITLLATGCGGDGDGGGNAPADDPEIVSAVSDKIEESALRIANATKDRNLPGPYEAKVVCLDPEQASRSGTPRDAVQCHVETFTTPTAKRKQAYVWSEDWRVPVQDGKLGEPEIVGEYRIRNYLRRDNRLNCSGGETPSERCTGEYLSPQGQSGAVPPTDGQQEVPIQP
jgi:hypothetical protein